MPWISIAVKAEFTIALWALNFCYVLVILDNNDAINAVGIGTKLLVIAFHRILILFKLDEFQECLVCDYPSDRIFIYNSLAPILRTSDLHLSTRFCYFICQICSETLLAEIMKAIEGCFHRLACSVANLALTLKN